MAASSRNSLNANDDLSSRKPARQVPQNEDRDNYVKSPENYLLGKKSRWDSTNDDHPNREIGSFSRPNDSDPNHPDQLKLLSSDFERLLYQTDVSDCWLHVQNTYMAVHRCVLAARSTVFASVFSSNFTQLNPELANQLELGEQQGKIVLVIKNSDPQTMKQAVVFMYTGKCDVDERNSIPLLNAAGRYGIKALKVYAGQFIVKIITLQNVLALIESAYNYRNKLVRQRCIAFFIQNAKDVMKMTEPWKKFAEQHPEIVAELLYWSVNKDEFLQTEFE